MHVASPELCRLVGECPRPTILPLYLPLIRCAPLDQAHVSKGVILSCAYLYGLRSLHLKPQEIAALT